VRAELASVLGSVREGERTSARDSSWEDFVLNPAIAPSALKIQALLGPRYRVLEFDATTRTSADAASAIGCAIGQIAKSLIFRGRQSDRSILVVACGANRVDESKIAALIGEKIARADADFVREKTGFSIGGVPPLGHVEAPLVLIDEDIFRFQTIWAAAGTPNAVFQLTPDQLVELTKGRVAAIA
jgi:prolyl-tRNA editing enzyme YbaK/EbsC (Cys-tRNA(Pro) deacylase)